MNAPATVSPVSTQIKPGQVYLAGRCTAVRKAGTLMVHLVVLPAPDEYSSPATVEILASNRIASPGDDCRVLCRVGGYRRQYKQTDKDTGEIRQMATADNKLYAIEA